MRSSTTIALLGGASLIAASPIANLFKKAVVYDMVIETVYITVTEGDLPATTVADDLTTTVFVKNTVVVNAVSEPTPEVIAPASSAVPPPPPAPTTVTPAPVVEVQAPATSAPAPVVEAPAPVVQQEAAPAPVAQAAPAAAAPSDFISSGLFYHNQHRANHNAPALTWDAKLASNAQIVADRCVFEHDNTVGGGKYGQNIDMAGMSTKGVSTSQLGSLDASTKSWNKAKVLGNTVTNNWYKPEEPIFSDSYKAYGMTQPPTEGSLGQYLHFTQIVWKNTSKVGCGVAYCSNSISKFPDSFSWFTVCNYASPGNFVDQYAENVSAPKANSVAVNAPFPST